MSFEHLNDEQKNELWSILALQNITGLGVNKRKKLVDFFGSPYQALQSAKKWDLAGLNIHPSSIAYFLRDAWRTNARTCWNLIKNCQANILLYTDAKYPALLKEIHDAPLLLFYLGDISLLQNISVAVVGARKSTSEGVAVAVNIVRGLTNAGVSTISGLANGIDRVVHIAGLEGIGSSIAVLGSGIDVPYPPANRDLYRLMQEKGLILSEFMPGTVPFAGNFPVRNRIISGLAKAVLVIEAALRSGTLSTARHATEQNREVFAVPGSALASTSEGCRELIRRGAKPAFAAEDILLELLPMLKPELENKIQEHNHLVAQALSADTAVTLAWAEDNEKSGRNKQKKGQETSKKFAPELHAGSVAQVKKTFLPDEPEQSEIVKLLEQTESCHIEDLAVKLNLPISKLSVALAILEIKGLVKRLPGTFYSAVLRI